MAEVKGHTDPILQKLRDAFQERLDSGEELGAAINVNINGRDVVDIWGGYADTEKTKPWTSDSITNVYSSTKTVSALAILLAHQRGLLNVDDPVAKHWPEFAENGKDKVLIRHVMSHTSGVSGWEGEITAEEICDVPKSTARLATQAPWWEPGTTSGYHATTQGHLLGEIIRRTTGKPMKQFVADEIAGPLKADFQIGAVEDDWPRISPVVPPPPPPFDVSKLDQTTVMFKTLFNPRTKAETSHTPMWRNADMSAVNGHGTAKGLNQILRSITLCGTPYDDSKLLTPDTVELIFREQSNGTDLVMGVPMRFGIGFCIGGGTSAQSFDYLPQEKMCFWTGWGGSFGVCDLQRGVTFTYVMNKMGALLVGNERSIEYARLIWQILKEGDGK